MMTFAVGEKVVYPNQGVGTIENISTRYFEQRPEKFYLLRLFCSSMTVMVPFSNAETIGASQALQKHGCQQSAGVSVRSSHREPL